MPTLHSTPAPTQAPNDEQRCQQLAAEAVLATLCGRAPARVQQVSLVDGIRYGLAPDPAALALNRGLMEDLVMVGLAGTVALELAGYEWPDLALAEAAALELLRRSLSNPGEQAVAAAYLQVLRARTAATLRRSWTEVQVVAAGLLEHGELGAEELGHRISCAQHLRGKTLN